MENKIVWINGSPRSEKNSNSNKIIELFSKTVNKHYDTSIIGNALKLCAKPDSLEAHFKEVLTAKTLVFVSPLYVDNMPSSVLDYLYQFQKFISNHPELITHPLNVYAFMNCGFLGGYQNYIALEIFENFANKVGFKWNGGLGLGSGEMFVNTLSSIPRESKIQKPVYDGIDTFLAAISAQSTITTSHRQLLVSQKFFPSLFIFMLNIGWLALSHWKFRKIYDRPYLKK